MHVVVTEEISHLRTIDEKQYRVLKKKNNNFQYSNVNTYQ